MDVSRDPTQIRPQNRSASVKAGGGGRTNLLVVMALLTGALAGCTAPDGTPPAAPPSVPGSDGTVRCEKDAVKPFAQVPAPGHPFGLAVHEGITYVSTSAGFVARPSGAEHVFAFSPNGTLTDDLVVEAGATMGLFDLAFDSSNDGDRLYIVDMNGRVLRAGLGPAPGDLGEAETYVTIPEPHGAAQWFGSMPAGMAFDPQGTAYLADDHGRVWKIPPGASPSIWFESPRIQGMTGPTIDGAFGARMGPDGKLYLAIHNSGQPESLGAGVVYRVPIGAPPEEADLEEFARLAPNPESRSNEPPPGFTSIAFGASGRLYVSLATWNAIAVFKPDGTLDRTIASPLLSTPVGLAFLGEDLLVTNSDRYSPSERPEKWQVLRVCVQDGGLPLNVPRGIP